MSETVTVSTDPEVAEYNVLKGKQNGWFEEIQRIINHLEQRRALQDETSEEEMLDTTKRINEAQNGFAENHQRLVVLAESRESILKSSYFHYKSLDQFNIKINKANQLLKSFLSLPEWRTT
jgi:hypothetical protein